MRLSGKELLGSENSQCKDPAAGARMVSLRRSKLASEAKAEETRGDNNTKLYENTKECGNWAKVTQDHEYPRKIQLLKSIDGTVWINLTTIIEEKMPGTKKTCMVSQTQNFI